MRVIDVEQGSAEWFAIRCGKVTSAGAANVVAKLKRSNDEAAKRYNYRVKVATETLTRKPEDQYVSWYMEEGKEQEPFARAAYEMARNCMVEQVGFVLHPTIDRCGVSPDGLVGDDGGIEIKAPKATTHIGYLLADEVPEEYQPQMLLQMACCPERKWWDFVSYCPTLPQQYRLFIKRMKRDDARIAEIEKEVQQFLVEVDSLILALPCGDGRSAVERQMEATLVSRLVSSPSL